MTASDTFEKDARNHTTRIENFEWGDDEAPSMPVVTAVASLKDVEPTELAPLSNAVDTDALNSLFATTGASERQSGYVQFDYEGCSVRVSADGTVTADVTEHSDPRSSER